jgi:hypothetical protein
MSAAPLTYQVDCGLFLGLIPRFTIQQIFCGAISQGIQFSVCDQISCMCLRRFASGSRHFMTSKSTSRSHCPNIHSPIEVHLHGTLGGDILPRGKSKESAAYRRRCRAIPNGGTRSCRESIQRKKRARRCPRDRRVRCAQIFCLWAGRLNRLLQLWSV